MNNPSIDTKLWEFLEAFTDRKHFWADISYL